MASHHHDQGCCESATVSSVNQTMDEMNFERGLWSAALSGEIDELGRRLATGADVNARDKSGYTALVRSMNMSSAIIPLMSADFYPVWRMPLFSCVPNRCWFAFIHQIGCVLRMCFFV